MLRKSKSRSRRRFLKSILALIGLFIAVHAVENYRGKRAWSEFVAKSKAVGEILDTLSLVPGSVPVEDNFASIPLIQELFDDDHLQGQKTSRLDAMALRELRTIGPRKYPGKRHGVHRRGTWRTGTPVALTEYVRKQPNLTDKEAARIILAEIAQFDEELIAISEAAKRPYARFPVQWETGFTARMPHLSDLPNVARLFDLRSVALLRIGNSEAAFADFVTGNRLGALMRDDASVYNLYVSARFHARALENLWEGLRAGAWDEAKLIEADEILGRINLRAAALRATRFNRAEVCTEWINLASSDELEGEGWFIFTKCIPDGWFFQNSASYGETLHDRFFYRNGVRIDQIEWSDVEEFASSVEEMRQTRNPYRWFSRIALPMCTEVLETAFQRQAEIYNGRIAIALERYRLRHGQYPDQLNALQPDFLQEIPSDIITGEPLKYLLRPDGLPCVYSVGINRIDEGGLPRAERATGDWAWQYSMPEGFEISDYYYYD